MVSYVWFTITLEYQLTVVGSFAEVYKEDDLTQLYPSISFKGLVEFCHPGQRIDEKSTYLIVTNTHLKLISFQKDGIILVKNVC